VSDSEAQIMREVCRDVQTEPTLLPINENYYQRKFRVDPKRREGLRLAFPIYLHLVLNLNVGKVFAPPSLFPYI